MRRLRSGAVLPTADVDESAASFYVFRDDIVMFPISYSIPKDRILAEVPQKTALVMNDSMKSFQFKNYKFGPHQEEEYHQHIQQHYFGDTRRKGGFDCLRHYELMANGCVPIFHDLEHLPKSILRTLPRALLLEAKALYGSTLGPGSRYQSLAQEMLTWAQELKRRAQKEKISTESAARYILQTLNIDEPSRSQPTLVTRKRLEGTAASHETWPVWGFRSLRAAILMSFTREEVAKHSTPEDAWIVVDGDVYDVTKFAQMHPGGTQILLDYAGQDATEDFYSLHRQEVLDKYQRLKKGRLSDAGPAPLTASHMLLEFSQVPFAEPAHLQGFRSPYFNESHVRLRQEARKFFAGETLEEALECEAQSLPPSPELRKRMGELGLIAMIQGPGPHLKLPKALCGGVVKPDEFNYFHEMVIQEERCRTMCPGYEDGLDAGVVFGLPVLRIYGSEWMRQEVVPAILRGDQCCVLAITEAFAGSDVAGLRTYATLDASGENYIVNGTKKWITGGMYADWFVTAVRTGKPGAGGISMMLIPRSEQVQTKILKTKYSSAAGTAYVTFENCTVPKKCLIGQENKGFQIIMSNFNHERWMITTQCIARARICTAETFKWAMQRKVFGKPLIEQPVIREKLAQMFAGVEACSQMLYDITFNMNSTGSQGVEMGARIALLKFQTTRMNHLVADNAVQVFGGRGVTQTGMGRVVEVFSRNYKIPSVYGGSEEIMADLAVRTAIKTYPKTARL
ncbi:unnamed protein product [Effrenium voratum]|nr:unnamed protein product [Effrenium voratum]